MTVGGKRHPLPSPFFVLATQNPIEQEGTYPLPEAQLDRFMLQVQVDYPTEDEEFNIVRSTTGGAHAVIEKVLGQEDLLRLQEIVTRIPVADHVIRYALQLTRTHKADKALFDTLLNRHGVQWLVELTATLNFFVFVSGIANAFEVDVPADGDPIK